MKKKTFLPFLHFPRSPSPVNHSFSSSIPSHSFYFIYNTEKREERKYEETKWKKRRFWVLYQKRNEKFQIQFKIKLIYPCILPASRIFIAFIFFWLFYILFLLFLSKIGFSHEKFSFSLSPSLSLFLTISYRPLPVPPQKFGFGRASWYASVSKSFHL